MRTSAYLTTVGWNGGAWKVCRSRWSEKLKKFSRVPLLLIDWPMFIIGIDPGVHNLAVAVLHAEDLSIVEWRLVDLVRKKKPAIGEITLAATAFVREFVSDKGAMAVRIEQQPVNNTAMKVLSHVLQALFLTKTDDVTLVNPKTYKLAGGTYPQRKRDSVRRVGELVAGGPWQSVFDTSPKKDDLADALLLARFRNEG